MNTSQRLSAVGIAFLLVSVGGACGKSKIGDGTDAGAPDGGSGGRGVVDGAAGTGAPDAGGASGGGTGGGAGTSSTGGGGGSSSGGLGGGAGRNGTGGGGSSTGGMGGGAGRGSTGGLGGGAGRNGTGGDVAATQAVNLKSAVNYVILAKSGISTVPASVITGNLGISPATATAITQFSLIADSTNLFSTSSQVTGKVYAADYAAPTPSNLTTAIGDMELAFTDASGRAPTATEVGAGSIGGMTLTPGVYKWGTGVLIARDVTLMGGATAVWIFQIAQDLTMGSGTKILLTGGAVPKNIFWQVSGGVVVGTTAHVEGIILGQTSITLATGASINGRLMAQTAVTLDTSTVVQPAP